MTDEKMELNLENLQKSMKALEKPILSDVRKRVLRDSLLCKLDAHLVVELSVFARLVVAIKKLTSGFQLDRTMKASMKERILDLAETHSQKRFFWSNFWLLSSKLVSATLLVAIVSGLVLFTNVNVAVVRAESFTSLDSFEGNVSVERGGRAVPLSAGMKILKNDRVRTGVQGSAVIKYLDDSVSRLAADSDLLINQLSQSKDGSFQTYVEVSLVHGTLWSKVVNLLETNSAFVVQSKDTFTTAKKAAFNVQVTDKDLQIGVFNHVVEVKNKASVESVVSGKKVVLEAGVKDSGVVALQVKTIGESEKKEVWVRDNLQDDQQYLKRMENSLLLAKAQSVGIKPGQTISYDNSLKDNTLLLLTFDDVGKQKMQLDLVEKDFIAAQLKLHDPKLTDADKALAYKVMRNFADQVEAFYKLIGQIGVKDKKYAAELKSYLDNKLLAEKKDLSMVLPDSPVYKAREIVQDLELLGAKDNAQLLDIKVNQAAEKLGVAEEVKNAGDEKLAQQVAGEYSKDMNGVIGLIDKVQEPQKKEDLVARVSQNIDLLEAINVAPSSEVAQLKGGVEKVIAKDVKVDQPVEVSGSGGVAVRDSKKDQTATADAVHQPENVVDGPYGVQIKGDKALPPML